MYTSRLKDGRKKEKDATTNLFTRLLYYQHLYCGVREGGGIGGAKNPPKKKH